MAYCPVSFFVAAIVALSGSLVCAYSSSMRCAITSVSVSLLNL